MSEGGATPWTMSPHCTRPPAQEYCRAALLRVATRHKELIVTCLTEMQRCRDEYVDITYSAELMKHDAGWGGPPLAARMAAALTDEDLPQAAKDHMLAATDGYVSHAKIWMLSLLRNTPTRLTGYSVGASPRSLKDSTSR